MQLHRDSTRVLDAFPTAPDRSIRANTRSNVRWMSPRCSDSEPPLRPSGPCIVYVFPAPVWPYASRHPWMPRCSASASGRPTRSNISSCVTSGPTAWSNWNARRPACSSSSASFFLLENVVHPLSTTRPASGPVATAHW